METWLRTNEREVLMVIGLVLVFAGVALVSLPAALVVVGAVLMRLAWPPSPFPLRRRE